MAYPVDSQQPHHHLRQPLGGDPHHGLARPGLPAHPELPQVMGQPIGPRLELPVAQHRPAADERRSVRLRLDPGLEQRVDRLLAFIIAAVIMLVIVGRRACKHGNLLTTGTFTQATVEGKRVRSDITINSMHPYNVSYRFSLPAGGEQTGEDLVTDLEFAAKLDAGTPVGVIYNPSDPSTCTIFRDKCLKHFSA